MMVDSICGYFYGPQTKFAKVMLSQVSVCPGGRGMRGGGGRALQRGMRGRRDDHCSERYAPYWNAVLFNLITTTNENSFVVLDNIKFDISL